MITYFFQVEPTKQPKSLIGTKLTSADILYSGKLVAGTFVSISVASTNFFE